MNLEKLLSTYIQINKKWSHFSVRSLTQRIYSSRDEVHKHSDLPSTEVTNDVLYLFTVGKIVCP